MAYRILPYTYYITHVQCTKIKYVAHIPRLILKKVKKRFSRDTAERNYYFFAPEAEFLDAIGTKVVGVFLLAIHSHLY
jgi:hypothetical protein